MEIADIIPVYTKALLCYQFHIMEIIENPLKEKEMR